MSGLAEFQASFAAALASGDPNACPGDLADDARARFRIYRNNVRHALAGALAAAYPAVARLVGDAFFRAMAHEYARTNLPRERTLVLYGDAFPDFVAGYPAAVSLPYLADVAWLERSVLEALHAADAPPLDPARLLDIGAGADMLRFVPHPAARLVISPFPVAALWRANRDTASAAGPQTLRMRPEGCGVLVTRPKQAVEVAELEPSVTGFAAALLAGHALGHATNIALRADPNFDLADAARTLLVAGAFAETSPGTAAGPTDPPPDEA